MLHSHALQGHMQIKWEQWCARHVMQVTPVSAQLFHQSLVMLESIASLDKLLAL